MNGLGGGNFQTYVKKIISMYLIYGQFTYDILFLKLIIKTRLYILNYQPNYLDIIIIQIFLIFIKVLMEQF